MEKNPIDPLTRKDLKNTEFFPNRAIKKGVDLFMKEFPWAVEGVGGTEDIYEVLE